MNNKALTHTNFQFPGQSKFYKGKVRDVYFIGSDTVVLIASDRISAFDVVLPKGIPGKGQVLNQIAAHFLEETRDIVPNWLEKSVHPQVSIGKYAIPYKVEMVVRGCLTGHAWRVYKSGSRNLCGIDLPDGMLENQPFISPIITPTTKADLGEHDEDISREDIIANEIVSEKEYVQLEKMALALFARGQEMAAKRGLILVDTKYEFGKTSQGQIVLIDEIHTPDSSRYFLSDNFEHHWKNGIQPRQLSKEFVRTWLMENGFSGKEGEKVPDMSDDVVASIQLRYAELYERITGTPFEYFHPSSSVEKDIEEAVSNYLLQTKKQ